jgi:hypothetical protein
MYRPPLIGFFLGIIIDILIWFCGPLPEDALEALCKISWPVAQIVSWITGWKFQQEEAIMIYIFAIPITLPLIGLFIGFLYVGIRNLVNKNSGTAY